MKVEVVPHDPNWRTEFDTEAQLVDSALGENVIAIHHIGSTSIPNIYSKPVIDILVEVEDLNVVEGRSSEMESLGYEVMGEFGIEGRRYFRKDNAEGVRTHQIHVFQEGSDHVRRHIAFRDYLNAHPDEAKTYSNLKRELVQKYNGDAESYIEGKDDFIKKIDQLAAAWFADIHS